MPCLAVVVLLSVCLAFLRTSSPSPHAAEPKVLRRLQEVNSSAEESVATPTKKKPRFVIHVGPMKTGTSSVQADFEWLMSDYLEQDGWHYINLNDGIEKIELNRNNPQEFLDNFKIEADKLLALGKNIIRSREQYSPVFSDNPWMYEKLKENLSGWDVLIVAGYRPYSEWMPSWWFQAMRAPYSDPKHPEDRIKNPWRYLSNGKMTGELYRIEAMFPNFYNFWTGRKRFTDAIVDGASPVFPVKVLDIHDPKGARSAFLCDILGGDAPISCQASLEMDKNKPAHKSNNKSNLDEVQYDAIAMAAIKRGLVVEDKWRRSEVIDAIIERQEVELKLRVSDLPLLCPDEATYKAFWDLTIELDRKCLPEKVSPERESTLLNHFEKAKEHKKYCHVDVDAVLEDSGWRKFFEKFSS